MSNSLEHLTTKWKYPEPIKIIHPELWLWETLAKALFYDPPFRFFFGERHSEKNLYSFFEAVICGTLESGGSVFTNSDCKAVLVWRWLGSGVEVSDKWKQQMFEALGPEGTKRYLDFRQVTDISINSPECKMAMRPNYLGVQSDMQGQGYGSHLLKWTLNYFDEQGYNIPFLTASTRRSAKLYGPLLGFYVDREVFLGKDDTIPVIIMKRINNSISDNFQVS